MLKKQKSSKTSQLIKLVTKSLCLLSLLSLIACGAKDQKVPGATELVRGMSGSDSNLIKDESVNCFATGEECPGSIAKIVTISPGNDKHCTGFLINNQTLLTAASCLPDDLRDGGQVDCSSNVFIIFPKTKGMPELRLDCGSIEYASPIEDAHPAFRKHNWAQIKLAMPVDRETFTIKNEGIARAKDKKYISWRVSTEGGKHSIVKKYECDVIEENYGNPLAKGKFYPNTTIGNCSYYNEFGTKVYESKIFRGNLGAPLLSSSGNVVGIIGDDVIGEEEYKKLATDGYIHFKTSSQDHEPLQVMKFATNLACVPEFFGDNLPVECTINHSQEEFNAKRTALLKSETSEGMEAAEKYVRDNNQLDSGKKLQWDISFGPIQDQRREVKYEPRCYNAPDAWLGSEDSLYFKIMTFKIYLKTEAQMKVSFNNLGILVRLNGFLQPEARPEIRKDKATVEFDLTVKPHKIKKKKDSEIISKGADAISVTKTIPVCP